jgi:hypothetical protein
MTTLTTIALISSLLVIVWLYLLCKLKEKQVRERGLLIAELKEKVAEKIKIIDMMEARSR